MSASANPQDPTEHRAAGADSETLRVLSQRVSVRRFLDRGVDEDIVNDVLRAAFRAPTSSNIQAYSVVVVREPEARRALAVTAGNQQHIIACPVFLAFCADLTRIEAAMARHGHDLENNNFEMGLVSTIDAALVGMSTYLAADSVGLKGVMIGAMRNDPEEVARILGLPPRVFCVFGMCLGYAEEVPPQKPRMDLDAMVHQERFDTGKLQGHLDRYDSDLAAHYAGLGRATSDQSWTHEVDAKFSVRPRDGLRAALRRMGVDFA